MRISKDGWVLIVLFVLLCVGGYLVASPKQRPEVLVSASWNPDPQGVKAFYTLLDEKLDHNVSTLTRPYTDLPKAARMLVVVQPGPAPAKDELSSLQLAPEINDEEIEALDRWVKKGGVVIFMADNLDGVPAAFGSNRRIGRGAVYAYSSRAMITNKGMRNHSNAMELLSVMNKHVGKRDLILFDEYHHGEETSKTLWDCISRQAWIAIGIILCAIGVMCYSYGRRFGALRNLPESETLRPGYEFVESVARLYQRANATDLAAEVLCASFKHDLCARLGMPSDARRDDVVRRLGQDANSEVAARVDSLLASCEASAAGHRPSEQELLLLAKEIHKLEKELGLGSING